MAAITGIEADVVKDGVQVCESTKWTFEATAENKTYSSNCSRGRRRRATGVKDATGSIEGKWDPGKPVYGTGTGQVREGDIVHIFLYIDAYQYIDVPAIIDSFRWEVDMENGELIGFTINFSQADSWVGFFDEQSSNSSSSFSTSSSTSSSSSS